MSLLRGRRRREGLLRRSGYINTHQTIDIIRGGRSGRQLLRGGDTNVYADTDGWIVAYFTRDELHGNAERNDRNT